MGEKMEVDSNNEFEIVLCEAAQSDGTILCKLSPEISAVDMEIRWFKETDCVCFYKNKRLIEGVGYEGARLPREELEKGNVSLQLKELDAGDYLCQITSEDITEITVRKAVPREDQTVLAQTNRQSYEKIDREWTDKERIKMANSALLAVFCNLEKTDAQKKDPQNINAAELQTEKKAQTEENDMQQEDLSKQMTDNTRLPVETMTEKRDEQKKDPQNINAAELQTEKKAQTEEKDMQQEDLSKQMTDNTRLPVETMTGEKMEVDSNTVPHEDQTGLAQTNRQSYEKVVGQCSSLQRIDKEWTDKERIKMANSALLAEKRDAEKKDPQNINAAELQAEKKAQTEEKDMQQEDLSKQMTDNTGLPVETMTEKRDEQKKDPQNMNAAELQTEKKENDMQQEDLSKQMTDNMRNPVETMTDVNMFIYRNSKPNDADKQFTGKLESEILLNLREVDTVEESNIILVFCIAVSRTGTDIDEALKRFNGKTDSKLVVLVVLHHTFDPEKTVPDSSRCVNRTDILTVDCLFHEDKGLLKCQKNSEAINKAVNWLKEKGFAGVERPGQKLYQEMIRSHKSNKHEDESQQWVIKKPRRENYSFGTKRVKVFSILAGKTNNCDKKFIAILGNRIENLKEVDGVDEGNIILIFCPIVSRTGTDIDAALKKFSHSTDSKLVVLVVLHHTFDPEKTVPDSSRCVNRTDILTVDCLFYEDTGLLKCQKNTDAIEKAVNWLKEKGREIGIPISPFQNKQKASYLPRFWSM